MKTTEHPALARDLLTVASLRAMLDGLPDSMPIVVALLDEDANAAGFVATDAVEAATMTGGGALQIGGYSDIRSRLTDFEAERDALRDALEAIGDADVQPGHVCYLTKARMAEVAREALAKGEQHR